MPLYNQGVTGPRGATGSVAISGDIYQGSGGNVLIRNINGYSLAGVTGLNIDVLYSNAYNKGFSKSSIIDTAAELQTIGTAYTNILVWNFQNPPAGPIASQSMNSLVAKVIGQGQSGMFRGRWTLEADYEHIGATGVGVPTGVSVSVQGPGSPAGAPTPWVVTMSATGITGTLQVKGHSGVQWLAQLSWLRTAY